MAETHHLPAIDPREISIPQDHALARLPLLAGGVGAVFLIISFAIGLAGDSQQLWYSYLVACLFFISLGLGCMFFVLATLASRAGWSVAVRRLAEHGMATLPVLGLLMLPLLFLGLHDLYHWTHEEAVAADPLLQSKSGYLNESFFLIRSIFYLLAWTLIAWWFRKESMRQDEAGDPAITRKLQSRSAPALIVFGVTLTFAAFDWIMSLDPHWYSTIFGVYFFAGCFLGALALMVLKLIRLQARGLLQSVVTYEHFHDIGKLLFGFVVFWAYIAFSQFMLIWYGSIPEETLWYEHRWTHGWQPVSIFMAVGHFALPFFFLLPVSVKRRKSTLSLAAVWLLLVHYIDLYWLVMPSRTEVVDGVTQAMGFHPHLLDLTCLLGVAGVFLGTLGYLMKSPKLVPVRDPRLAESLSYENI
ncbi:MAG TPA: hypothetical protein VLU25_16670 [Acidobacteriota bacterium]|nr:hypothetical protein [Acidobacteriota bacterium]